jgi:hypothetical protein
MVKLAVGYITVGKGSTNKINFTYMIEIPSIYQTVQIQILDNMILLLFNWEWFVIWKKMCIFYAVLLICTIRFSSPFQINYHLFTESEVFCGPETAVNNGGRGATKHTSFPTSHSVSVLLYR